MLQKRLNIIKFQELLDQKFPLHVEMQPKNIIAKKSLQKLLDKLIKEENEINKLLNASINNIKSPDPDGPLSDMNEFAEFEYIYDDNALSF